MAYPHTAQTIAQTLAAIQTQTPSAPTDGVTNALWALANALNTPLNTPVLVYGVLVLCTTGFGTPSAPSVPQFSYDATTIA